MTEPTATDSSTSSVPPPTLEQWAALLAPGCLAHRIQLPFALKWIDLESGLDDRLASAVDGLLRQSSHAKQPCPKIVESLLKTRAH